MRDDVMHVVSTWWRSLVFGLAAAVLCAASAFGQSVPFAERIQLCGACHGEDGNSRMENIPSLAGQPEFFILNQLFLMREGVRRIEVMMPLVKDLKDDEMDALAKHFSKLAPKASDEAIDPALVTRGGELAAALHDTAVGHHGVNIRWRRRLHHARLDVGNGCDIDVVAAD